PVHVAGRVPGHESPCRGVVVAVLVVVKPAFRVKSLPRVAIWHLAGAGAGAARDQGGIGAGCGSKEITETAVNKTRLPGSTDIGDRPRRAERIAVHEVSCPASCAGWVRLDGEQCIRTVGPDVPLPRC